MKKFATLVLVLLLTVLTVLPAAADQPSRTYDVPREGGYEPIVDCRPLGYDFEIWDHYTGLDQVTVFYDQAGNVRIMFIRSKGVDSFFRPDRPDWKLSGNYSEVQQLEMISTNPPLWEFKVMGPAFDIQLQGEPKLVHVSGTITVLEDAAGNWLEVYKIAGHPRWDIPGLCEYFAG